MRYYMSVIVAEARPVCEFNTFRRCAASAHVVRVDRGKAYLYPAAMALTDEDVGRNVRDLRVERKMTQAVLASRVYLGRTAVSRLESGQRAATLPELASIADVLGVNVGYLAVPGGLGAPAPATRMTYERHMPVESSRPPWAQAPALRPDPSATIFGLSPRLRGLPVSLAVDPGMRRARNASKTLTGHAWLLGLELLSAVATVLLMVAVWAGLLAAWFTLLSIMFNGRDQAALGQADASWLLPAILLGPALTGGGAYVLSLLIRKLAGDWFKPGGDLAAIGHTRRDFASTQFRNQSFAGE